jgi:hypothetical protein
VRLAKTCSVSFLQVLASDYFFTSQSKGGSVSGYGAGAWFLISGVSDFWGRVFSLFFFLVLHRLAVLVL